MHSGEDDAEVQLLNGTDESAPAGQEADLAMNFWKSAFT
jgi:hypothetical protein